MAQDFASSSAEREAVLLGIDIGTYESKGALVTTDGRLIASATRPHDLSIPQAGWAEHDAEAVWWRDVVEICRELLEHSAVDPSRVLAVACSAIAPCMLPLDVDGKPLRPAILYGIDTRAADEIEEIEEELSREQIFAAGGNYLSTQSVGPKVRWFAKNQPELFDRTARVVTASTYLNYRLTGEFAIDYYTATTFQPMFDLRTLDWSSELVESIMPRDWLPRLAWAGEEIGQVTESAAAETGLPVGIPVVAGTADAASEAVSAGAVQLRDMMVMYGSTTFFIETTERLETTPQLWAGVFLEPDTYALAAGMSTTGALTRWFRDHLARDLTGAMDGGEAYAALIEESESTPVGSDGLVMLPYFSGERTPINDPRARGAILGLTLSHSRGHLFRAVLEGIAYGVRHHVETMGDCGVAPRRLVAVGGGTKNQLWLQTVSDVTGLPQDVPKQQLGAAYGDCFLAGMGAGVFGSLSEVEGWIQPGHSVEPNRDNASAYDELYGVYRRLYSATRDDAHRLARFAERRNEVG